MAYTMIIMRVTKTLRKKYLKPSYLKWQPFVKDVNLNPYCSMLWISCSICQSCSAPCPAPNISFFPFHPHVNIYWQQRYQHAGFFFYQAQLGSLKLNFYFLSTISPIRAHQSPQIFLKIINAITEEFLKPASTYINGYLKTSGNFKTKIAKNCQPHRLSETL